MSTTAQRLYELLPAIYRIRDAEQGKALETLISVIAEQVEALEENLEQLYDDQFIETCAEWVIPYIGDLIGYRTLHGVVPKIASPRAEVANTIGYRRRKGTASMLEQLARDVTDWNARAVEFFELLATTQYMNHVRLHNRVTVDLRDWEALERLNTAFETMPRTVDVRRIATGEGKHNIPNIGIFLWRLNAYSLTRSPAVSIEDGRQFMFSPLGHNTQLFTRPETDEEISHLAEPINAPAPISRRVLDAYLDRYYGEGKSFFIRMNGNSVPIDQIQSCDLSDIEGGTWAHQPEDFIGIDPVLGRIAFPQAEPPPDEVLVDFHYGFSADLGGGKYEREQSFSKELKPIETVSSGGSIQEALALVSNGGVVEIQDSHRYKEALSISVNAATPLELRAANEHRPTVVLADDLEVTGEDNTEVILNGLLIVGGALRVPNRAGNGLRRLILRHCTLVPGLTLNIDGEPEQLNAASVIVESENVVVEIAHCILGGIRCANGTNVEMSNSILDAMASDGIAYAAPPPEEDMPGGHLEIHNGTVIGKVFAASMPLVSNSIFLASLSEGDDWPAPIRTEHKQMGCVRFSYVPPGSRVPRQHRCQPDLGVRQAITKAEEKQGPLTEAEKDNIAKRIHAYVRPQFTALQYGQPGYCQLVRSTPAEIRTGAEDESEMGAFHNLYQPQRETNLRVRLEEYLRFGLEAGIFYES